jgi:D-cysteine desulfhydrase
MDGDTLERFPLTQLPTPVRRLAALQRETGHPSLWVKCDDRSGRLYGGNKPRKLEFLLAQARRRGRTGLLTTGGIGTHHGLATAIAARAAGMRCVLVLLPQPVTAHVCESLLLAHAYGAELHLAESLAGVVRRVAFVLVDAVLRGQSLALIPTGGTSALGAVGYLRAGLELAAQVEAGALPAPDTVFVALGSGGTAAGLLAGFRLAGLRTRVVAVLVTDILPPSRARLTRLAGASIELLRRAGEALPPHRFAPAEIEIDATQLGAGYGAASAAGDAAAGVAHALEGIELEPTYTAKCFAAFLAAARRGTHGENLLFWNTFSSIDPRRGVASLPRPAELPPAFHRFFADAPQQWATSL